MPEFDEVSEKRLFQAIVDNETAELNKMVEEGYPVTTATFGKNTATALHLSLSRGEVELITIQELIRLGADIYAEDSIGRTPLQSAVSSIDADSEVIEYLRELYGDSLTPEQARSVLATVLQTKYTQEEIEDDDGNVYNYRDCMLAAIGRSDLIENSNEESNIVDQVAEYLNQAHIQETDGIITRIEEHQVNTAITNTVTPEMINAVNSLYKKESFAKEDSLISFVAGMFKEIPYNLDSLFSDVEAMLDSLGIDLTKLIYLVSISSGSGHLPMYHGGFPGGDSGGGFGGSGVAFDAAPLAENEYVVTVLGNGTIIVAEQDHSM